MRIPGVKTVKSVSRWVRARMLGGALILGYHRIARASEDVYEVCVSPEKFAEHLEILKRHTHPVSLSKLVHHLKAGTLPPKSVAVTFDDGYADNLYEAKPLLEKYEVPATVFICTGNLGREFWWDELDKLVSWSTADLDGLHLQMRENRFLWEPPSLRPEADSSIRMQIRHSLYHFLLTLDVVEQERAMEIVRHWSGLATDNDPASRTMNQAELLQLASEGLVELGSHTRNHLMLPRLSLERQRDEILSGKRDLETLLEKPVQGFSYPNGRATREAKEIVREAGFAYACTSLHDVVRPGSDMFEMTRFWQEDVNGEKFMQGINLWMGLTSHHG